MSNENLLDVAYKMVAKVESGRMNMSALMRWIKSLPASQQAVALTALEGAQVYDVQSIRGRRNDNDVLDVGEN